MEGVYIQTDGFDETTTSFIFPVVTNNLTEDMMSKPRVFGPQQLNPSIEDIFNPRVVAIGGGFDTTVTESVIGEDVVLNSSSDIPVESTIAAQLVTPDKTEETDVDVGNKRPRRSAAIRATQTIKQVLKWERCSESSTLFKNVDHEINQEFDRFTNSGRGINKEVGNLAARVCVDNNSSTGPTMNASTSFPQKKETELVGGIASDDECDALKSDLEDCDDDCDDSDDDEEGSLASFVVDDDYISDEEEIEKPCKKTKYESQSESGSESGGSDSGDNSSDDEDESVQYDDDSDADVSDESESENVVDLVSDVAPDIVSDVGCDVTSHVAPEVVSVALGDGLSWEGAFVVQSPSYATTEVDMGDIIPSEVDVDISVEIGGGLDWGIDEGIGGDIDVDMTGSHELMHGSLQDSIWFPEE